MSPCPQIAPEEQQQESELAGVIPNYAFLAFIANLGEFRLSFWLLTAVNFICSALRFTTVVILGELVTEIGNLTVDAVLWWYLPLWAACLSVAEGLNYFTRRYGETLPQKIADQTLKRITRFALSAPLANLRSISREKLFASLEAYARHVERFGQEWSWSLVRRFFSAVVVLVVLFLQNPWILAFNVVFVVGFLTLALRISSKIAPFAAKQVKEQIGVREQQTAFVMGLPFLKRFGAEDYYTSSMASGFERSWGALNALKEFHAWRWFLQLTLFNIMTLVTIGYGAYQVAAGQLDVGFLVLLKWSFDELFFVLVYIIESYVSLIHEREDAILLREQLSALDLTSEDEEVGEASFTSKLKEWQELNLREICVQYGSPVRRLALPPFRLRKGEIVGVVGESGSGKTSLLEVLGGYTPFLGDFKIDGLQYQSGESFPLSVLMVTPHDPLFNVSIRDNLCLGESFSEGELWEVLKAVSADGFIKSLDQQVGEAGFALSTGQVQRLRLARGLLHSSQLLLLDEPLTGVDPENRGKIVRELKRSLKGRSAVIVTHGQDELELVDRVVEFDRAQDVHFSGQGQQVLTDDSPVLN